MKSSGIPRSMQSKSQSLKVTCRWLVQVNVWEVPRSNKIEKFVVVVAVVIVAFFCNSSFLDFSYLAVY